MNENEACSTELGLCDRMWYQVGCVAQIRGYEDRFWIALRPDGDLRRRHGAMSPGNRGRRADTDGVVEFITGGLLGLI